MDRSSGTRSRTAKQRRVFRRALLALSGSGLAGALAGCSSDGPDAGVPSEEDGDETDDASEPESSGFDASFLGESASSHVGATDGFADAAWLDGADPDVYTVTSLEGSGEGSLRRAIDRRGPRIVVFEVGGVVDLEGESIEVTRPGLYVAGQTAPSPGITLIRGGLSVAADDVIVQHLRVRPGDDVPAEVDCLGNAGGANVIVDHCSASWGTDESVSTNSGPEKPNVTFSNNLIAECLNDSIHPKGPHSYGTLVMDRSERVTIAGNLWANSVARHPRLKGGSSSVVANNVAYNFERGLNLGGGVDDETRATIVGNCYRAGPRTPTDDAVIGAIHTDANGPVTAYVAHNETMPESMPVTGAGSGITMATERPLWPDGFPTVPGRQAYETVLSGAGARPADRTYHDVRIVENVREGTGAIIDSQEAVGGYPELPATSHSLDVPDDDLGEWLWQWTRAVEDPTAQPP
ncbi:pectate lyase family protein [Halosolutus gelatinilyticus]|uniref:pectate lyase family protein n=1 Tax=Halosolutus gelatinilyticus TaxID=2931975 RepID=UPI001FF2527F|nr:pectate lyase [Halosolutus gelatinilyticus]